MILLVLVMLFAVPMKILVYLMKILVKVELGSLELSMTVELAANGDMRIRKSRLLDVWFVPVKAVNLIKRLVTRNNR